jgi:outer membrane protein assembly factor BamB
MLIQKRILNIKYSPVTLLSLLLILLTQCRAERIWPDTIVSHEANIQPLWVRSSVYTIANSQSSIVSASGKLFLLGSDNESNRSQVIAFDCVSGDNLWRFDFPLSNDGNTIAATTSEVLIGGAGEVLALDIENGHMLWSTGIPNGRAVIELYILGNNLYVDSIGSRYSILDIKTGNILQSVEYDLGKNPPFWKINTGNGWWENAVLVDDLFYSRMGEQFGRIIAFNKTSDLLLWVSENDIVSNIVATPTAVYALSLDGKLLRFDPLKGTPNILATFSEVPFNLQSNGYRYYYYLAFDKESQVLFITMGDSAQLFGIRINK